MSEGAAQPLILARALTKSYRLGASEVVGLNNVNLDITAGELVALKGNSGSGKSTLLALMAGLDQPTGGKLVIGGQDLKQATPAQLTQYRRKVVGIVFQSFNLLPTLTVLENVALPALLSGRPREEVEAGSRRLLDHLGLSARLHHMPAQLSGGEMQRTSIARALINDPAIVLADEPTGNLDSRNGRIVIELLAELNRELGVTVVIATHSDLADTVATAMIRLKDGALAER